VLSFNPDPDAYLAELAEYVAIPSVSRDADPATMRRAADWLAGQLASVNGRVEATSGHPVVIGEWIERPGAPTVLVYGHYDVQPTGDLAEWKSPPFELTRDADVVRARGVSDDKGPVFMVLKVVQAFMSQEGGLPLNVRFLIEGEEEIGSPNLAEFVRARAQQMSAALVVSADGAMWRPDEPSISLGSKGLVSLTVEVTGAAEDLHSGRYGGTVANPAAALAAILAGLHNLDGAVLVPGFYRGIPPLSPARRAEIAAVDFDEAAYARALGAPEPCGERGYTTLERLWERPTLEVNGMEAGGKYTVIPHLARAHISCRLVEGQDPGLVLEAVSERITSVAPPGVRVRVLPDPGSVPAYVISADHPAVTAATRALAEVYPDQPVLFAKIGGSVPATDLFARELGCKTLFFSFSTADERLHAPNEFLRLRRLSEGMRAWESLLRHLGQRLPQEPPDGRWATAG
jgi:acetylornithine deacetylase/succinyl-diaminopimelate desuccinylase-like protein